MIKKAYESVRAVLTSRVRLHQAYQSVFSTPDGQVVLAHIMKVGNVTRTSFTSGDPHRTSLEEGKRQLALSILRFVGKDHDQLVREIEQGLQDENK